MRTTWAKHLAGDEYEALLEAMKSVDESIRHCVPSNENQYGPYRIGPAFPFSMKGNYKKPNTPDMMFGNSIYKVINIAADNIRVSPYSLRVRDELRLARQALQLTRDGLKALRKIKHKTPELKKLIDLVQFLSHCHQTAVNYKEFYICHTKLLASGNLEEIHRLADRIEQIAHREIKNTQAAIPLVQRNSDFGYEASMGYQCDEAALRWKLKHMAFMLRAELAAYKRK